MEAPDLIGTKAACAELDIDRVTLGRWIKDGRVTPALKLPGPNGAHLFYPADIAALKAVKDRKKASA